MLSLSTSSSNSSSTLSIARSSESSSSMRFYSIIARRLASTTKSARSSILKGYLRSSIKGSAHFLLQWQQQQHHRNCQMSNRILPWQITLRLPRALKMHPLQTPAKLSLAISLGSRAPSHPYSLTREEALWSSSKLLALSSVVVVVVVQGLPRLLKPSSSDLTSICLKS